MIRIDAIIKPERVNLVLEAMSEAGCTGFTYSNVTGKGNQDELKYSLEEEAQLRTDLLYLKF